MLTQKNRIFYFLIFCIGLRTIFAILPLHLPKKYLTLFGIITLIIGSGFMYLYLTNQRMDAPEGGGKTWWANYRLLHSALYLTASAYLLQKDRTAYLPLTIDVILGLFLFYQNHV